MPNESDLSPRYLPLDWTLPSLSVESQPFFSTGRMLLQQCQACGLVEHPPEELCRSCHGMEFGYVEASPCGVIESFSIVHHAMHPLLKGRVPYNVVIVSLDSHPDVRIVGNVVDVAAADLRIGGRVKATWAEIPAGEGRDQTIYLPQWRAIPDE